MVYVFIINYKCELFDNLGKCISVHRIDDYEKILMKIEMHIKTLNLAFYSFTCI